MKESVKKSEGQGAFWFAMTMLAGVVVGLVLLGVLIGKFI